MCSGGKEEVAGSGWRVAGAHPLLATRTPLEFFFEHVEVRPLSHAQEPQHVRGARHHHHIVGFERDAELAVERRDDIGARRLDLRPEGKARRRGQDHGTMGQRLPR